MSHAVTDVRTSLEVGFDGGELPETLSGYRGRQYRSIPASSAFPFEDAQFEVVMLAASAVGIAQVREAHRVLKPEGRLYFIVPEKTSKQGGFSLPEIYSIVRNGFDIVGVTRPPWWHFGLGAHTLSISARKKNWKVLTNTYRPYV